ncbi:YfcE family phosphodiesterase [Methanobrevibacter sp. 87.7]|uniref:metallophosphoesterase n=1 Tax=Methanobrevibacter sp. 87.7 TaxID=387957 RepID=UPI000B50507D|nr:metallophosphoesterase [Methanobrevibacter sp. 87.7]OWT32543.1 YfcE family phosphodiesterase [Methanobrevibacter sp. 87.7]
MKIGLISDTHIPDRCNKLPEKVYEAFRSVDLILHAGDLTNKSVISELEKIAPTIAVQGNMDRYNNIELPKYRVIEKENIKIGLIHGEVYPKGDKQQLYYLAEELGVKILVSGHSHIPTIDTVKDVLLVNPGSPTSPRLSDPSVMIMEIKEGNVDIEAIQVGMPSCKSTIFLEKNMKK